MKRNFVGNILVLAIIAALFLATPVLAQKAQELKEAHKMMSDGWKMYTDGQRMVIKGQEMNNLVAQQMGFTKDMEPGDRYIQNARKTASQAATLFAKGNKTFT